DHPAHHLGAAGGPLPVPVGRPAFRAFGTRREPVIAASVADLEIEVPVIEGRPVCITRRAPVGGWTTGVGIVVCLAHWPRISVECVCMIPPWLLMTQCRAFGTWLTEVPRIWRTPSRTS